jgi:hypothetical protein
MQKNARPLRVFYEGTAQSREGCLATENKTIEKNANSAAGVAS